jgi:nucleotide-binding universal stress UspA family protein
MKLNKVLVPVDFSAPSREALRYAVSLAKEPQATVMLLYVVDLNLAGLDAPAEVPRLVEEMHTEGERHLAELASEEVAGVCPVATIIRSGRPFHEIVEAARELKADLIVLATHGYTKLKHVLLGSTAERVVRHADCPVLVVRGQPAQR